MMANNRSGYTLPTWLYQYFFFFCKRINKTCDAIKVANPAPSLYEYSMFFVFCFLWGFFDPAQAWPTGGITDAGFFQQKAKNLCDTIHITAENSSAPYPVPLEVRMNNQIICYKSCRSCNSMNYNMSMIEYIFPRLDVTWWPFQRFDPLGRPQARYSIKQADQKTLHWWNLAGMQFGSRLVSFKHHHDLP